MAPIVATLVLLLAAQSQAATIWRHQFQYVLKDNSTAGKQAALTSLQGLIAASPVNGTPTVAQFGSDLGISSTLYGKIPGAMNQTQADVGGRIDFHSLYALATWWAFTVSSPNFTALADTVSAATRIQYLVTSCGDAPAPGTTVYRHSFEYKFPETNATHLSDATLFWANAIQTAPVTPVSYAYGIDLGLGPALYNKTNYDFGASLEFGSQANLTAFWAWLFPQTYYQALVLETSAATRFQYNVTY